MGFCLATGKVLAFFFFLLFDKMPFISFNERKKIFWKRTVNLIRTFYIFKGDNVNMVLQDPNVQFSILYGLLYYKVFRPPAFLIITFLRENVSSYTSFVFLSTHKLLMFDCSRSFIA